MRATKLIIVPAEGIGLPDYSAPKPTGAVPVGPVYTLTDLAELAARLGSIVTHDRRGNVIFLDDFEGRFKWYVPTGTGVISTHCSRNGESCAKLTVDPVTSESIISRNIIFPVRGKLGFEYSFAYEYLNLVSVWIEIDFSDGAYFYYGIVRWVVATGLCQYYDETGQWQNIIPAIYASPTVFTPPAAPLNANFNVIKLVIDAIDNKYVRLIVNNVTFDLSGKSFRRGAATGPASPSWVQPQIFFESINNAGVMYVGHAIVTQNEPENAPVAA